MAALPPPFYNLIRCPPTYSPQTLTTPMTAQLWRVKLVRHCDSIANWFAKRPVAITTFPVLRSTERDCDARTGRCCLSFGLFALTSVEVPNRNRRRHTRHDCTYHLPPRLIVSRQSSCMPFPLGQLPPQATIGKPEFAVNVNTYKGPGFTAIGFPALVLACVCQLRCHTLNLLTFTFARP